MTAVSAPNVEAFYDHSTGTVSYLVCDPGSDAAAIIDPVWDFDLVSGRLATSSLDRIMGRAAELELSVEWVLETHAHADHLSAASLIRKRTGAKIGIGSRITEVQVQFIDVFGANDITADGGVFDCLFEDNAVFSIGEMPVTVLHTPGHTPACISYLIGKSVFVGDTLFMPDFGTARTDFPGGDARTLYQSTRRLLDLAPDVKIYVGHDYPSKARSEPSWVSTVAEQKACNIHVRDVIAEDEFVSIRTKRDETLGIPRLILPSLQVNIRGGALPPADGDGEVYFRTPINKI